MVLYLFTQTIRSGLEPGFVWVCVVVVVGDGEGIVVEEASDPDWFWLWVCSWKPRFFMSSFSIRPLGEKVGTKWRRKRKRPRWKVVSVLGIGIFRTWSSDPSEFDIQKDKSLKEKKGQRGTRDPRRWRGWWPLVENLLLHPTTEIILTQMSTFAIVALVFLHAFEISSHDIFAFTCEERRKRGKDRSFRERRETEALRSEKGLADWAYLHDPKGKILYQEEWLKRKKS